MLLDSTAVPLGSLTARGADVLLAEEAHPHRIFVYSGSERQVLENGRPAFFDSLTVAVKAPSVRAWKTTRVLPFEGGLLQQVVEPESAWYVLILWDRSLEMYKWPEDRTGGPGNRLPVGLDCRPGLRGDRTLESFWTLERGTEAPL
jgi:hypothetical protein